MKHWTHLTVLFVGLALALVIYSLTRKKAGAVNTYPLPDGNFYYGTEAEYTAYLKRTGLAALSQTTLHATGIGDSATAFPGNPAYMSNPVIQNDNPGLPEPTYRFVGPCPDGTTFSPGRGCLGGGVAPRAQGACPDGTLIADNGGTCPDPGVDPVGTLVDPVTGLYVGPTP
jgi:hypothetical protein